MNPIIPNTFTHFRRQFVQRTFSNPVRYFQHSSTSFLNQAGHFQHSNTFFSTHASNTQQSNTFSSNQARNAEFSNYLSSFLKDVAKGVATRLAIDATYIIIKKLVGYYNENLEIPSEQETLERNHSINKELGLPTYKP